MWQLSHHSLLCRQPNSVWEHHCPLYYRAMCRQLTNLHLLASSVFRNAYFFIFFFPQELNYEDCLIPSCGISQL